MPEVELVDMRGEFERGNHSIFSARAGGGHARLSGGGRSGDAVHQPARVFQLCLLPEVRLCGQVRAVRRIDDLSSVGKRC